MKILRKNGLNIDFCNCSLIISEGIRAGTHGRFDIVLIKAVFDEEKEAAKKILSKEGYLIRDEEFNYFEVDWNRYFDCEKFENRL